MSAFYGIYYGMSMSDYLVAPGRSSSSIKDLLASPLDYRRKRDGLIKDKSSAAQTMGTALHSAILEGKLDYHVEPLSYGDGKKWNNNATECKAWYAAHRDKPILDATEAAFVAESFSYVRSHPKCADKLTGGHAEVSCFAEINGTLFKCRPDYYKPGMICDLKSVADASTRGFSKAVLEWGWHIQAAINVKVLEALGDKVQFNWIALEKGQLPKVNVIRASQAWQNFGWKEVEQALALLLKCRTHNYWPEWSDYDGTNDVHDLPIPAWAQTTEEIEVKVGRKTMNL